MKEAEATFKYVFIWLIMGIVYFTLESIWKGYPTNYRMFILSGTIGLFIGLINNIFTYETDFLLQCFTGAMIALLCECIFGYQWNIIEGLNLWDYSAPPLSYFSFVGDQINLFFGLLWIFLSGICIIIDDWIEWRLFKYRFNTPPYYKIFNHIIAPYERSY